MLRLPTGDGAALAGASGLSAALWAETSGTLTGPDWLYGTLAARPPPAMSGIGRRFVGFARLGIIWRPLDDLALWVQAEIAWELYTVVPGGARRLEYDQHE